MSRIERAFWTAVYFITGITFVVACVGLGERLNVHEVGTITGYVVLTLWVSAWRQFRRRIIHDMRWSARTLGARIRNFAEPPISVFARRVIPAPQFRVLTITRMPRTFTSRLERAAATARARSTPRATVPTVAA